MARPGLRQHPKFKTLARRLGEPEAHVLGHLECGWECCYQNGDPVLGSPENVEAAFEWDGEPEDCATAWFVVLERARIDGDAEREAHALRELRRLGVSVAFECAERRQGVRDGD